MKSTLNRTADVTINVMRKDKNIATDMRRNGSSYMEIYHALKVPRATLSDWFSKENWSNDIRKKVTDAANQKSAVRIRDLNRVRGINLMKVYDSAREEAVREFEILKYNPLFIAGLMLYWGEGDKLTKHVTRLTNTDPELIRLFVIFLKNACQIPREKIRANVLIYPDLNPLNCIKYWSTHARLETTSFTKCITIQGRHKTRRLSYGVCIVSVSSTYFKAKINVWLHLMPQELMNKAYYASI